MCENDITKLLDALRGQHKDSAAVLIARKGNELMIASSGVKSAITASVVFDDDTRAARNTLAATIMQVMLVRNNDND